MVFNYLTDHKFYSFLGLGYLCLGGVFTLLYFWQVLAGIQYCKSLQLYIICVLVFRERI